MVDYSKWDSFAADLSDSDDDGKPIVTKLNDRSKVHIGPSGVSITSNTDESLSNSLSLNQATLESTKKLSFEKSDNGGTTDLFHWNQTRYEVQIYALLPKEARACDVKVQYDPESKLLEFSLRESKIFGGILNYPIEGMADDIDWEIKRTATNGQDNKSLFVTLKKKSIISNATVWWSCIFIGDPEIDVTQIKGRGKQPDMSIWEQAHSMFKERIEKRQIIEIDTSEEQEPEPEESDS